MKRASSILFFLCAIGCAVFLFLHLGESKPPKPGPVPAVPPPRVAPSPSPRLAAPAPLRDAGRATGEAVLGEAALMEQIRALVKSEPERAEALAREARHRFPDGAAADERDALLVDALINQQHIGAARDETYYYIDHHPEGRFAEHLFVMTGVHPPPSRSSR
jgi:hypothetical protein